MKRLLLLLLLASPSAVLAQAAQNTASDPVANSARPLYQQAKAYLLQAAEQMPEAEYAYKPTPEVRSFGQLIGHIANAQYAICGAALGEQSSSKEDIEKARTTKAPLMEALRASFEVCDRAHAQADAALLQSTKLFGRDQTRLGALILNTAHDFEHYGNLVTYMRMKGMVPPSSQPRS